MPKGISMFPFSLIYIQESSIYLSSCPCSTHLPMLLPYVESDALKYPKMIKWSMVHCIHVVKLSFAYCSFIAKTKSNWFSFFPLPIEYLMIRILCVMRTCSVDPQSYEEERRLRTELELRSQRLTLELADNKQHIQEGDYRRHNYPNIKRYVRVCFDTDEEELTPPHPW